MDFMQFWAAFNAARADFQMAEANFAEARFWFESGFSAKDAAQAAKWGCKS